MTEVYLIDGRIEDGLQGVPFTLGIFIDLVLAHREIIKFIGNAKYYQEVNSYMVEEPCRQYTIKINKYDLNKLANSL